MSSWKHVTKFSVKCHIFSIVSFVWNIFKYILQWRGLPTRAMRVNPRSCGVHRLIRKLFYGNTIITASFIYFRNSSWQKLDGDIRIISPFYITRYKFGLLKSKLHSVNTNLWATTKCNANDYLSSAVKLDFPVEQYSHYRPFSFDCP